MSDIVKRRHLSLTHDRSILAIWLCSSVCLLSDAKLRVDARSPIPRRLCPQMSNRVIATYRKPIVLANPVLHEQIVICLHGTPFSRARALSQNLFKSHIAHKYDRSISNCIYQLPRCWPFTRRFPALSMKWPMGWLHSWCIGGSQVQASSSWLNCSLSHESLLQVYLTYHSFIYLAFP